jgi:hypothetical protein
VPAGLTLLCTRDEDVLGFDIAMHDLERMQVSEARRNLAYGALGIEGHSDLTELVWPLNDIGKRGRAQLKSDVKEACMRLLVIIPNDIRMIVRILEKVDLAVCECNKVLKETFDCDSSALQGTHVDDSAMRPIT